MYIGSSPENFVQISGIAASRLGGCRTPSKVGDERSEMEEENGVAPNGLEEVCRVQRTFAPQRVLDD
jgi:hypothetical protein